MGKEKKTIGNPHNNRKSNSVLLSRCFRLLEYLKLNTDSKHTITQAELRRDPQICGYLGTKASFNKLMQELTVAINTDASDELKAREDWRLVYKSFSSFYNEDCTDDSDDNNSCDTRFVKDIYYNHIFSDDEITQIINALRMSKTAKPADVEKIICKIKNELVSKHYKECSGRIYNSEYTDSELLDGNLMLIQQAVYCHRQITYRMNYYNSKKQLVPVRKTGKIISPHYIVTNGGRFYVIGCFEDENKTLCIIRIDLMSDIMMLDRAVTPKKEIRGLPDMMKNDFKSLQLNMSYDAPIPITMRITKKLTDNVTGKEVINHTFVHDIFGDGYTVLSSNNGGDIIRVNCSPFAVRNLALQYSDVIEMLTPETVRQDIKGMIKKLNLKYNVKGEEI